jgi:superfamily I DNA and/or RNA helicase/very-short-patch-repair endonuclease
MIVANLSTKMEYWKNRLLDLGKRNRLINCTLPKTGGNRVSRTALLILQPSCEELWNTLVEKDNSLEFAILTNEHGGQLTLYIGEEADLEPTFTNDISTNQSPVETCKTLRSLMKKAREFTEEKGLNALYLAFGFLNWKENGTEGQDMRSPLILVPVELTQESINDPIVLSRSDDEITTNRALEQKLLNDFSITLPQLDEDNWQDYLSQVTNVCSNMKWHITCDAVQLSLFSFLKINMYRDLEKHFKEIALHRIVRALNGEIFDSGINISEINNYNHDKTEPKEVFSVVDADSSQQDAILLAKRGVSFVLQGPPGTGKSQTITNIIAELIADGKKVLFVSEKMAALDVVYKRLKQSGISDFCLTLHSHNAKRKEILNHLEKSMKLSSCRAQLGQTTSDRLYQLKDARASLNAYVQELHTVVNPLGKTIFEINGFIASYGANKNIDYVQTGAESFTPELLSQCEVALEELTRIVEKSSYQQSNPWNECVLTNVTHEFRQQFLVNASQLLTFIDNVFQPYTDIIKLTGATRLLPTFAAIQDISALLDIVSQSPNIPFKWLKHDLNEQITNANACSCALGSINKLDVFINNLKDYIQIMLTAINKVADSVRMPILTDNKQDEAMVSFDFASEKFVTLLPTSDATTKILAFRESFTLFQRLGIRYEHATIKSNALKDTLSAVSQSLNNEQQILNQKQNEWKEVQSILLEDFDEKVLTIDVENMLSRYRTTYRSVFSRMFSGSYKNDKKMLLAYFKQNVKLAYAEVLTYLNKMLAVQVAKLNYEKQIEVVHNTTELMQVKKRELEEVQIEIAYLSEQIEKVLFEFKTNKQSLLIAIESSPHTYLAQVSDNKRKFADFSLKIAETLSIRIDEQTDFIDLRCKLEQALQLQEEMINYAMSEEFMQKVCTRDKEMLERFKMLATRLIEWTQSIGPHLNKFAALFEDRRKRQFSTMLLMEVRQVIQQCQDNFALLEYLIDYRNAEKKLVMLGIDLYLKKAKELNLAADEIIPVFKKCFYRSWLDVVIPKFSTVGAFRRERQDERIAKFKDLDKLHMEISKAALIAKLISRLPSFDTLSVGGEVALLRREMAKQRKLMPIRKLIASIPNLLPAIKPCIMMSPLSVSTYLGSSGYKFDTVVFDEASQVRTEDAICSIFRAKQAIIAGDSNQLPPTDFFSSSITDTDEFNEDEEGVNDTGAYESLLDEASLLPTQMLLWHYRSKHEHLIAFSNAKIYQGNLITFPSSVEKADGVGVEYIHVPGGIYERGGKNGNKKEAERIALLVFEHFGKYPNRSLGVIAFGEVQQTAIEEAVFRKREQNPQYEIFFKDNKEEAMFIKNLETVQGDERDTIIFSIGYAPDTTGKFIMNFGPLSRNGGERRLNVAVTRARYNLKLVGSISPTDIKIDQVSGKGPKLLRQYIDFAINGPVAILGETTLNGNGWFDSSFEESVYDFLGNNGYNVTTQVGCSGYRIDMAVRHPKYDGRFAIGIECDGRAYHSSRTARERDRLRQTVLEDMGWKIYRIWSTDWIKDQRTEGERLLEAVDLAINSYREEPRTPSLMPQLVDFIEMGTRTAEESEREKSEKIKSRYIGENVNGIPLLDIETTMLRVLEFGFGLDKTALFKETALYGYGWQRQGSAIKEKFERAYKNLLAKKKITENGDTISIAE